MAWVGILLLASCHDLWESRPRRYGDPYLRLVVERLIRLNALHPEWSSDERINLARRVN